MKINKKYEIKGILQKQEEGDDSREFRVVASTSAVDREGEVIEQSGWDLENYLKNPVILWAHDIESLPIGKATKVEVVGDELLLDGIFAEKEANPMAEQVMQLFKAGIQQTVSVGFIPIERDGETITKAELLEVSFVPVPANPEALARAKELKLDYDKLIAKPVKVEGSGTNKKYDPTNLKKLLMKKSKQEDVPSTENGLAKEVDETVVELKEVVLEIIANAVPDIETAVEKQLEGEPVILELMKEVEEIIEKSLDEVETDVIEDVTEVITEDKNPDDVIAEADEVVEAILKDVGAEIADEVATVIEAKAQDIMSAVEEDKQADAEQALAPIISEIESAIEKEVEEVLIEHKEAIADEAVSEAGTGDVETKEMLPVCDPTSTEFDPEECARISGEVKGAHEDDEEEPKRGRRRTADEEEEEEEDEE